MKMNELTKSGAPPSGFLVPSEPSADEDSGGRLPESAPEVQFVTETTPNGTDIYYSWFPRRHYKLKAANTEDQWQEVPSVTNILGVLDKSGPLTWWGMRVGIDGFKELNRIGAFTAPWFALETDEVVQLLTEHKLTVNHVKDRAADRGVNVHAALEKWCETGEWATPSDYEKHEWPYVEGLLNFLKAITDSVGPEVGAEIMVGSLEHLYAGRYDLNIVLEQPVKVVTRCYPKKADKVEEIPAGRYLLDLKTSKRVYPTHFLQLEAYEKASVECGYEPTDYRGVVHVTADGKYELVINQDWCFDDFAAVRQVYTVMNEREVLRVLREDLGAKEVAA